jgi:hypothetical protein
MCALITLLGIEQALRNKMALNGDGLSYLDLGEQFLAGEYASILNGYWGPLYGLLLAVGKTFGTAAGWSLVVSIKVVNLLIFMGAISAALYFLREFENLLNTFAPARQPLFDAGLSLLTLSLFMYSTLQFIGVHQLTPDMGIALMAYLGAGLTLRLSRPDCSRSSYLLLGVVFGVGYWWKSPFLPIACFWLATLFYCSRWKAKQLIWAALALFCITSPLILGMSLSKGRPTFSESSWLSYAWYVNRVPVRFFIGDAEHRAGPTHRPRLILTKPRVFEFDRPFNVTYPPWCYPSYYNEGVRTTVDLKRQWMTTSRICAGYVHLLSNRFIAVCTIGLIVLLVISRTNPFRLAPGLLLSAAFPFIMYSFVHHEPRFTAPFLTIGFVTAAGSLSFSPKRIPEMLLVTTFISCLIMLVPVLSDVQTPGFDRSVVTGEALSRIGVGKGAKLALLGGGAADAWPAKLLDARVVVQLPPEDVAEYVAGSEETHASVASAFLSAGAEAAYAVSVCRPDYVLPWQSVPGGANAWVARLR